LVFKFVWFQIQFMLLFSRQGKLRLQKWFTPQADKYNEIIFFYIFQWNLAFDLTITLKMFLSLKGDLLRSQLWPQLSFEATMLPIIAIGGHNCAYNCHLRSQWCLQLSFEATIVPTIAIWGHNGVIWGHNCAYNCHWKPQLTH